MAVVFDGFELLDLAGPSQVFSTAARLLGGAEPAYRVRLAAVRPGRVRAADGIAVHAEIGLCASADTLLVVGGIVLASALDPALVDGVRKLTQACDRVASVCSGAYVLAEAGLLDGRAATTHWAAAEDLARRYPAVEVHPDRIHVRDGPLWTSAGVSAGTDLALAMVAADHGADLAREVARWLVVYLHRPGGQSQFSAPLAGTPGRGDTFAELRAWIEEHPGADLSLAALADRAGTSVRHFSRRFAGEVGESPGRYVERVRMDAARRLLETTDHTLDHVARLTGLGAPETLYRVFHRNLGVSPGSYRRRFASAATISGE
ncbi:AraC family transcriptional regulator with amidase-like domain [Herbihabitans rhizosphaerae]|uniref:AraC family transcriptional regulator with amidase-like domain n=1 Tax=Herbihabitans rhizosphaerae TaxID=1872711 RepID=A0A4Q7L526_9PSEU|nr:AraC family transcriptional regulator with amidase-like domain [Herbihabitans rhizosphaerae]